MDKYCKLVPQKHWKGVKIYNDVKEITKARFEADGIKFPKSSQEVSRANRSRSRANKKEQVTTDISG